MLDPAGDVAPVRIAMSPVQNAALVGSARAVASVMLLWDEAGSYAAEIDGCEHGADENELLHGRSIAAADEPSTGAGFGV